MKCWECRKEIKDCYIVTYLAEKRDRYIEKTRCICKECYKDLKSSLNSCHYIEVRNIRDKKLDKKWYE